MIVSKPILLEYSLTFIKNQNTVNPYKNEWRYLHTEYKIVFTLYTYTLYTRLHTITLLHTVYIVEIVFLK